MYQVYYTYHITVYYTSRYIIHVPGSKLVSLQRAIWQLSRRAALQIHQRQSNVYKAPISPLASRESCTQTPQYRPIRTPKQSCIPNPKVFPDVEEKLLHIQQ